MRDWPKAVLAAGGGIVAAAGATVAVGGLLWNRKMASTVQRLLSAASASHAGAFSRAQLEGLPDPVVRYFEFALTPGQSLIQSARLEHQGEMRIGGFDSPWRPFSSSQHISTDPPIERSYTPARYREVSGAYVPTPWAAAYRNYAPADGMKVPMEGGVEWILPEGRLPVWRGWIRRSEYKFGR
jgi:hypothetical protein